MGLPLCLDPIWCMGPYTAYLQESYPFVPPPNFLHINTELLHVYSLAWLSYIYLPLCSEKASAAKPYHLLPLSKEIPHKLGKVLLLSLDLLSGTHPTLPLFCFSILKGMLDSVKILYYVFQFTWFFQKCCSLLFYSECCLNAFWRHFFTSTVGFDPFEFFHRSSLGSWTSF